MKNQLLHDQIYPKNKLLVVKIFENYHKHTTKSN
jgi:hypothetical protein